MATADLNILDERPALRERSLISSTAAISAFTVLARVAGAGKTALITLFFRPGDGLDTYLLAFLIPSFLADVFIGALNPVLVPVLVEARETKGRTGVTALYGAALYRCVLSAMVLALLTGCCAAALGPFGGYWRIANSVLFQRMLLIMIPILPLTAVAGVWRSVLNAELRYGAASFSYLLTPIIASLVLGLAHSRGVISLAIGSAAGLLTEVVFLACALRHARIPLMPAWKSLKDSMLPLRK